MTVGRYLAGIALLGLIVGPLAFAAWNLRRRFLPALPAAVARLAEIVVALAMMLAIAEILGTFGVFRRGAVVLACAVIGAGTGIWARRGIVAAAGDAVPAAAADASDESRGDRLPDKLAAVVAVLVVAVVIAQWTPGTVRALSRGMEDSDTIAQHMPFAARFVHEGSTTNLPFLTPDVLNTFHPANSELVHAVGILPFGRDILSPLINIGWLLLTLLAAWCIGRRFGAGSFSLLAIAVVLASPLIVFTQAGAAKNDVTSVFFILAAVAIAASARWERPAVAVAGLAAGLAAGTRLTALAPVAALTVGMIAAAPRDKRKDVAVTWIVAVVAAGAYWYGRNLARTGNPIPPAHVGFLPSPRIALVERYGFSVGHYLADGDVWRTYFLPGVRNAFGPAWTLLLALAGAGAVGSVFAGRNAIARVAGAASVIAAGAYVFMPTSAYGIEGRPVLFTLGLRYALPALGTGLILLPLLPWFRSRVPRLLLLVLLVALFLAMQTAAGAMPAWPGGYRGAAAVVGVGIVAAAAAAALVTRRPPSRRTAAVAIVLAGVVAAGVGWKVQDRYLAGRYTLQATASEKTFAWARNVHGTRIAFVGFFEHYPLYGIDLSNEVQYVGRRTPHGGFTRTRSCREFRQGLRDGRYRFLVVAPAFGSQEPPEADWARGDPAATEVFHEGATSVFRYATPADPSGCPAAA